MWADEHTVHIVIEGEPIRSVASCLGAGNLHELSILRRPQNELVHRITFPTRAHAHRAVVRYIEMFYNRKRLRSCLGYPGYLGYKTPTEVHSEYEKLQVAA